MKTPEEKQFRGKYKDILKTLKRAVEAQDEKPVLDMVERGLDEVEDGRMAVAIGFLTAVDDYNTEDKAETEFLHQLKKALQKIALQKDN